MGFGRILTAFLKTDVEPQVLAAAASQAVTNLFPEKSASVRQAETVQAPLTEPAQPAAVNPSPAPTAEPLLTARHAGEARVDTRSLMLPAQPRQRKGSVQTLGY